MLSLEVVAVAKEQRIFSQAVAGFHRVARRNSLTTAYTHLQPPPSAHIVMARTMVASPLSSSDDPLSLALRPPPDETPAQKALRLQQEALAKQRSDAIDLEIEKERKMRKAQGKVSGGGGGGGKGGAGLVKVLLLGQSESGE